MQAINLTEQCNDKKYQLLKPGNIIVLREIQYAHLKSDTILEVE